MSVIMIVAAIVFWVACGVLAYGLTFAHLQREYVGTAESYIATDHRFAIKVALAGPFGLALVLLAGGCRHGLMFRSQRRKR